MTPQELQQALSAICEQISVGNYDQAKTLFDILSCSPPDHPLNLLVETLRMMLLRVEAREFELSRLLEEISEARAALKQNQQHLSLENRRLRRKLKGNADPLRPVAQSEAMQRVLHQAEQAAQVGAPLLLTGENGTGKDLIARYIHNISVRSAKAFVSINFCALPSKAVDTALFGVNNDPTRPGRFEQARGGTLLLNEIKALALSSQKKLLTFLETGFLRKEGGDKPIPVDVRVMAATNRDLAQACQQGSFLPELYEYLRTVTFTLPPLRERREDIPVLVNFFLARIGAQIPLAASRVNEPGMDILTSYHWPGNVRELENVIRNAALVAQEDCIQPRDLAEVMGPGLTQLQDKLDNPANSKTRDASNMAGWGRSNPLDAAISLADVEAAHIKKVLALTAGNKSKAASLLGISREGLRTKLLRVGGSFTDSFAEEDFA